MEGKQPLREAFGRLEDAVLQGDAQDGKTMVELEQMARDIAALGLFGRNESVEELPTSSLPYLLLPAFLGTMAQDSATEPPARLQAIASAKAYFWDFLGRLRDYGVAEDLIPREEEGEEGAECSDGPSTTAASRPSAPSVAQLNAEREKKIQRLRESQELERKVKAVREKVKNGAILQEEDERSFMMEKLRWWAHRALKDLEMIKKELPMLELMVQRGMTGEQATPAQPPKREPMKPIILTRDAVQKAVFGAGYPSMYTMTVREYMDMTHHLHQPTATSGSKPPGDDDEEENLEAVRALDEYKDFHRRGWGNTHNKG